MDSPEHRPVLTTWQGWPAAASVAMCSHPTFEDVMEGRMEDSVQDECEAMSQHKALARESLMSLRVFVAFSFEPSL